MSLQIRVMTRADIPGGMRLKELAGWNQTEEDWRRFLEASPEGCFVAEWSGHVAGTVTTIVYENRFAWIGMVLVDPQLRGKGVGTALLERAIDHLDAIRIPCLKLDATPQGRPIYERLGFRVEYEIDRCLLEREPDVSIDAAPPAHGNQLDSILEMDRKAFAADRGTLLRSVAADAPEYVIVAREAGTVTGYALGRKGSRADHLGPWVATNATSARQILASFLKRSKREAVFVDVMKDNAWGPEIVSQAGFRSSRMLTRMYRGENSHAGCVELVGAILGPEFG
jgi:GNAT superfamily N-acetyltransferase